jgi:predicted phosphodiesterase
MDIEAALEATKPEPTTRRDAPRFEYGWDGNAGYIQTGPLPERPTTWDAHLRDAFPDLDLDEIEVIEPVQVRGWDTSARLEDGTTGLVRAHYYRLNVQRRTLKRDLDALIRVAKRRKPTPPAATSGDSAFVLALGDLQLGKMDGDGYEGTVARYLAATTAALKRYRRIAKGRPVYLIHLGDCIEGYVSQGGANAKRTTLATTEQVELYEMLLLDQVKAFANVAPELTVCGLPGNHDEAHRPLHTYTDSWALHAVGSVRRACELAGNYEHVTFYTPKRDELTLAVDICGTRVGMAHGHQWRPGQAVNWWAKQAHGRQPVGDSDLLLSAHLHHLRVEQTGSDKTWMQVPALESGSQWWKHRTGEWGQPGVLTMLVGAGRWSALEVL